MKLIPLFPVHSIHLRDLFRRARARGAHNERRADLHIYIHVRTEATTIGSVLRNPVVIQKV